MFAFILFKLSTVCKPKGSIWHSKDVVRKQHKPGAWCHNCNSPHKKASILLLCLWRHAKTGELMCTIIIILLFVLTNNTISQDWWVEASALHQEISGWSEKVCDMSLWYNHYNSLVYSIVCPITIILYLLSQDWWVDLGALHLACVGSISADTRSFDFNNMITFQSMLPRQAESPIHPRTGFSKSRGLAEIVLIPSPSSCSLPCHTICALTPILTWLKIACCTGYSATLVNLPALQADFIGCLTNGQAWSKIGSWLIWLLNEPWQSSE